MRALKNNKRQGVGKEAWGHAKKHVRSKEQANTLNEQRWRTIEGREEGKMLKSGPWRTIKSREERKTLEGGHWGIIKGREQPNKLKKGHWRTIDGEGGDKQARGRALKDNKRQRREKKLDECTNEQKRQGGGKQFGVREQ